MGAIRWRDFEKVDMRVGKVLGVEEFPEARKPSYILKIDFGQGLGTRRSIAAIRDLYEPQDLEGRLVVAVINFPPKQIANHMSSALVLAAVDHEGQLCLLKPDGQVA